MVGAGEMSPTATTVILMLDSTDLRQLVLWGLKAVGGLAANLLLLTMWVDGAGLDPALAIFPNFVLISAVGYTLSNRYIFQEGVTPTSLWGHVVQFGGMQAANLVGKAANYLLYLVFIPLMDYRIAWLAGAVATFLVTFALNKMWWERRSAVAESA